MSNFDPGRSKKRPKTIQKRSKNDKNERLVSCNDRFLLGFPYFLDKNIAKIKQTLT